MNTNQRFGSDRAKEQRSGFTLTELVVVAGLLALLAAMVAPALASGRNSNRDARCLDNQRRLAAGWLMFASDHGDYLMDNGGGNPPWVSLNEDWNQANFANTNQSYLTDPTQSAIAQYVKDANLFKCPADVYTPASWPKPRVRSVSLNGALAGRNGGSGPSVQGHGRDNPADRLYYGAGGPPVPKPIGAPARTMSDLNSPGPARIFLILDEHPDSISDSAFLTNPGAATSSEKWRDLPASYHDGGVGISYADGHAEIHQWQERYRVAGVASGNAHNATIYSVVFQSYFITGNAPWTQGGNMVGSKDYEWMDDGMPYRVY